VNNREDVHIEARGRLSELLVVHLHRVALGDDAGWRKHERGAWAQHTTLDAANRHRAHTLDLVHLEK
jgi:hypothetical protein